MRDAGDSSLAHIAYHRRMQGTLLLVVNPSAGAGRAGRRLPGIEAALRRGGAAFETVHTSGPGEATRLVARAIDDGRTGVAIVGGDGTFTEAIHGLFDEEGELRETSMWVAPIPCGTGGDFRRTLRLDKDPVVGIEQMLRAEPRRVDCGWLEYTREDGSRGSQAFMNIGGFGIGGLVDHYVNEGPKWLGGRIAFLLATGRAALRYRPAPVRVSVDEEPPIEERIHHVAVANGQYFGGGMRIAPEARIDDGLFDVVLLCPRTLVEQAELMPKLYDGSILASPYVRHLRGTRVVAEPLGDEPVLLEIDGEVPGRLPATFALRKGAIRLRA